MKEIIFSKKALKDLDSIEKRHTQDVDFIEEELNKYLTDSLKADGNKIKEFANYHPSLFRLRINALESYRVYFRAYDDFFFVERIVLKKDSEKVLKNID